MGVMKVMTNELGHNSTRQELADAERHFFEELALEQS